MSKIATQNVTIEPRLPHMEVMNPQTGEVWLSQEPITFDQFKSLRVAPPLVKSGCTTASFDAAYFLRSPGAEGDGPLESCIVDGRTFVRVARALGFSGKGPMNVKVQKHHVMTFAKGVEVTVARFPDGGLYVQQTESIPGKTFTPPGEWRIARVRLEADWAVFVPPPVSVWFFPSLASFQGPLPDASIPAGLRSQFDTV